MSIATPARWALVCALALAGCGKKEPAEAPAEAAGEAKAAGEAAGEAKAAGEAGEAKAQGEAAGEAKADAPARPTPPAKPATSTGAPPLMLGALSAKHTVALGGFEGLDAFARVAASLMDGLPAELSAEMKKELPEGFASIVQKMGFDPRDAAAWKSAVGIDPAAGIAVVVDARLKAASGEPRPLILARVFDRGTLIAALDRVDEAFDLGLPGTDGVAELTTPGGRGLIGMRGDFTALLPLTGAEDEAASKAARAAFAGWLAGADTPLSEVAAVAPALRFAGSAGSARSYGAVLTGPLLKLMAGQLAPVFGDFYAQRFPALSMSVTADMKDGALRLLADEAAVVALRKLFVSPHAAPDLDRFAGEGDIAVGFAINPVDLFDGAVALIPPERGDVQGQVLIGKNAVPVVLGASLDDLGKALSGHVAVFAPVDSIGGGGDPRVVVAVGLADVTLADTVLQAVLDRLAKQAEATRKPAKFGALEGHVLEGAGPPTFAVRSGDTLLLGPSRAGIEAALAREAGGDGPQLDFSDGGFYGLAVSLAVLDRAVADAPPEAAAMVQAGKALWTSRFGEGFGMRLQVDDRGIYSGGVGSTMLVGVGAAVAIPAFMKYIQRSKAAQARVELGQLFLKATIARMEQKPLTAAPLTPAADPCADGGDGSYASTPVMWSHPTWKALGFAPTGKLYYRYAFEPGEGQGFTIKAVGDLDCDGVRAEYIHGADAAGQRVPDIERNPLE